MVSANQPLRTRVYVDGYNFYNGCLKRTPYKWLDLQRLFAIVLPTISLEEDGQQLSSTLDPVAVKYFTARILKKFARSNDSVPSQLAYHSALELHLGSAIEIIEGYFDDKPARAYLHEDKKEPDLSADMVEIWKLEEKQSDVALALHAYADAINGDVDHVVFATNDTDLVPAMKMIRSRTSVKIGLVIPTRDHVRMPNKDLAVLAHWVRASLQDAELEAAQLPLSVLSGGKSARKPMSWYPRPDLLAPIFEEAKRVKRSAGAAWKWLQLPCAHLDGRVPISMVDDDASAIELREYMQRYDTEVLRKADHRQTISADQTPKK